MPPPYDVCVVGSANLDLVATTDRLPRPGETVIGRTYAEHPGGKGLNQAVAAARSGAAVCFVGSLGGDDAGRVLVDVMRRDGIEADVETSALPSGRALIVVDAAGENSIVVVPGANGTVPSGVTCPPSRVVLAQLEVPIAAVTHALVTARAAGSTTVLNPAPARSLPRELLDACDVVVPNEHELELLGGVAGLRAAGCDVVVTLGAAGAEVHGGEGTFREPAYRVDVLDSTGAGDAFCGALAARLAAGRPLADAVRWANAAGALACTIAGAVPAQPRADAIAALVAG